MTREEAERLILMCEREWFRGADESVRKRKIHRTAQVLDLWEGEHGFDGETMSLLQPELGEPEQPSLPQEDPRRRSRRGGQETSLQAAESIDDLRERQRAVYRILRDTELGLTDEQLLDRYRERRRHDPEIYPEQSESGLRTRRHELVELGFAADSEKRREISTGRQAIVWRITDKR